jgi:hypothetical protein
MQVVAHRNDNVQRDFDVLPGSRVTPTVRTPPSTAPQPEGDTRIEAAFHQLTRPREHGEQLTEPDYEAAALVLKAHWPKFGAPRPLPERWR